MNTVEVNDDQIHAELNAAGAGKPLEGDFIAAGSAQPGATGQVPPQPGPDEMAVNWQEVSASAVFVIDKVLVPNWQLENDEKEALALGGERVLKAFFPNVRTDPRIAAVMALLTIAGVITSRRRDPETGALKPMRETKPEVESTPDADADRAAA